LVTKLYRELETKAFDSVLWSSRRISIDLRETIQNHHWRLWNENRREEVGALIYTYVRYDDGPHMIMKASLVNYYAGNYYRAYVSPGQVQTDGRTEALRERNLRIIPALILQQEQWPRWRHCRTITYVIRVDLLEFSVAATPLSNPFLPSSPHSAAVTAIASLSSFSILPSMQVPLSPGSRCRSLKLEQGNTIWSGEINFIQTGRNYLRAGAYFAAGAES